MYLTIAALILLAAYLGLLAVEGRRGARYFEGLRVALDRRVGQMAFIVAHVDFASFAREALVKLARRGAQSAVHGALRTTHALEGLLTRLVRRLRLHPESVMAPAGESSRTFVRTLSEFKGQLEAGRIPSRPAPRPEMSDVR